MADIRQIIESLLAHADDLKPLERATVLAAANSTEIGEDQVRVIHKLATISIDNILQKEI